MDAFAPAFLTLPRHGAAGIKSLGLRHKDLADQYSRLNLSQTGQTYAQSCQETVWTFVIYQVQGQAFMVLATRQKQLF